MTDLETAMTLMWKPLDESYEVSSTGKVRSVDRTITDVLGRTRKIKGVQLKPQSCSFGYQRVELYGKSHAVHILVAQTFVEPFQGEVVMHLDHNPANNDVSNLKWGTQIENVRATVEAGRYANRNTYKTSCPKGHNYDKVNSRGNRVCSICLAENQRRYRAKNKGA